MNSLFSLINNSYLLLLRDNLLDMTINNPLFIFALITIIWFIPGLIVRRITETKKENKRKKTQSDAIAKLYPKNND